MATIINAREVSLQATSPRLTTSTGYNAVVLTLTTSASVVSATSAGVVSVLPTGISLKLYVGNTLITSNVTYGPASTTVSGLTLVVNTSTGAITLTDAGWSSNQASFTLSAIYDGITYNTVYTIAKSLAGAAGATGPTGPAGSTGATGVSNHRVYIAASYATAPATPGTTTSGAAPAGWSLTPVAIVAGQAQWQSDGTTPAGSTTTTWAAPYQSYLKVASLEALDVGTGNLTVTGTLTMGTSGKIASSGTAYGGNGIFLGYDSTAYKFSVGTGTNKITFDGTTLSIPAANITGTLVAGQIAAGSVTIDKLLVRGSGACLNDDPDTCDISAWSHSGNGTISIITDTTSPSGNKALRCTSTQGTVLSKAVPIDSAKNYQLRMWTRQETGSSTTYLTVAFLDANGTNISGGAAGWSSVGTFFYFGLTDSNLPASWTEYRTSFGPSETAKIPSNAKFVQVGVLSNYSGSGTQLVSSIRLLLKSDADLIVPGSITAGKLSVTNLSAISSDLGAVTAGSVNINNKAVITSAGEASFKGIQILDSSNNVVMSAGTTTSLNLAYANPTNVPTTWQNSYVSNGSNLCFNSDFGLGLNGWTVNYNPFGATYDYCNASHIVMGGLDWTPNRGIGEGSGSFQLLQNNTTAGYCEVQSTNIPVVAGAIYCVSAYTGAHRCSVDVFGWWIDQTGAYITPFGNDIDQNNAAASGGMLLSGYKRHSQTAIAPSNAASVRITLRKFATNAPYTDSWMFVSQVQLERVNNIGATAGPWGIGPSGTYTFNGITLAGQTADWPQISGTGKPSDNASSDLVLVGRNVVVVGNSATKNSGSNSWDSDCYSIDSFTNGAFVSAKFSGGQAMMGLNSDPTSANTSPTDNAYISIDYAIFYIGNGNIQIYESGVYKAGSFGGATINDVFSITYDGMLVTYFKNGTPFYQSKAQAGLRLYFDSAFSDNLAKISNIRFGPLAASTGLQLNLPSPYLQSGSRVSKALATTDGWDYSAITSAAYTGGAYIECTNTSNTHWMLSLTTNPDINTSYQASTTYSLHGAFNSAYGYSNTSQEFGALPLPAGSSCAVLYEGSTIRWLINGIVVATKAVSTGLVLYGKISLYYISAYVDNVKFGPMSSSTWAAIAGRPANIANLTGSEYIKNTDVTVVNGVLTGVGTQGVVVDNTLVSGSNLLWGSQNSITLSPGPYGSSAIVLKNGSINSLGLLPGETLTLSADLWHDSTDPSDFTQIYVWWGSPSNNWIASGQVGTYSTTRTRVSTTFTLPANTTDMTYVYMALYHQPSDATFNYTCYADRIQLERGPIATKYSPGAEPGATVGASFGVNIGGKIDSGNVSTYVDTAAINLAQINVATIGSLSALTANLGSVTIGLGGSLSSGQTNYNTGSGFWLGTSSGIPRFSIGSSSGNRLTYAADTGLLTITNASIVSPSLTAPVIQGIQNPGPSPVCYAATTIYPGTSVSGIRFMTDGTIYEKSSGTSSIYVNSDLKWYIGTPPTHYIRFLIDTQNGGTVAGTGSTYLALSSDRTVTLSITNSTASATIKYSISTASDGSNVVSSGFIDLVSEVAI